MTNTERLSIYSTIVNRKRGTKQIRSSTSVRDTSMACLGQKNKRQYKSRKGNVSLIFNLIKIHIATSCVGLFLDNLCLFVHKGRFCVGHFDRDFTIHTLSTWTKIGKSNLTYTSNMSGLSLHKILLSHIYSGQTRHFILINCKMWKLTYFTPL